MATKKPEPSIKEMRRHFPAGYSKEIKKFVKERALVHSRYIWILDRADRQKGWCSYCRRDVIIQDGLKHKAVVVCPNCDTTAIIQHEWRGHDGIIDTGYFHYFEKSRIDADVVVCRGIYAQQNFSVKDVRKAKIEYQTHTFYVFKMGSPRMFTEFYHPWYSQPRLTLHKSVFPRFTNYSGLLRMNFEESFESLQAAVKGTPFQYSQWETYVSDLASRDDNLVRYLAFYARYPSVEYVTKFGLGRFVAHKLEWQQKGPLNYRGKTLQAVLKMPLNKKDILDLRAAADDIDEDTVLVWQLAKKEDRNVTLEAIRKERVLTENIRDIVKLHKYIPIEKIKEYFKKRFQSYQENYSEKAKTYNPEYIRAGIFFSDWFDYLAACEKLQCDMTDASTLYPKDLIRAHNNAIKQVELSKNEELDKKIRARAKVVNKFSFQDGEFMTIPATSSAELIAEGKTLHHCVGMYVDRYANGSTNIIFIRQINALDRPFFTMEVNNKNEIVQVRGNHNMPSTPQVTAFVSTFKNKVLQGNKKVRQAK